MKYWIILVLLLPVFVLANDTVTITWTPPTERVDGTPLTVNELAEYVFSCRNENGEHQDLLTLPPDLTQYETVRIELFPVSADYWCAMRVVDTDGLVSDYSTEVLVRHRTAPMPPADVIIEGDLLVRGDLRVLGAVRIGTEE